MKWEIDFGRFKIKIYNVTVSSKLFLHMHGCNPEHSIVIGAEKSCLKNTTREVEIERCEYA